jgi:Lysozyme like domain
MARYRSAGFRRFRRRLRGRNGRLAGSAAAAGLVLAVIAGHPHAPASAGGSGARVAAADAGGTLDCSQLEALWESAGGSADTAFMAAEIATAESGGRQYATDADGNGTTDEGYWQINTSHGALATYNPYGNARAAVIISANGTDWAPWVTYQTGAYAGKC